MSLPHPLPLPPGGDRKPCVVCLHGFASTPWDLWPIAQAFHRRGYAVLVPQLGGHQDLEVGSLSPEVLRAALADAVRQAQLLGNGHVFIVGFSLGALVALDHASTRPAALRGVLGLSTFAGSSRPWAVRAALALFARAPGLQPKRRFRTTVRSSRATVRGAATLPLGPSRQVLDLPNQMLDRLNHIQVPTVLLHSTDDPVASFAPLAERVRSSANPSVRLVTLHGLAHFIQCDMDPAAVCALALQAWGEEEGEDLDPRVLVALHHELAQESRHWSGLLFQLQVGFFSLFGALLAFTLPDVITSGWMEHSGVGADLCAGAQALLSERCIEVTRQARAAPYYIIAYALLIDVYAVLLSLYFFYMNRVDAFKRLHVDPLIPVVPWIQARTIPWATSATSRKMTKSVAFSVLIGPFLGALLLLVFVGIQYGPDRLFSSAPGNALLQALWIIGLLTWVAALAALVRLDTHSKKVVYGSPAPLTSTPGIERAIARVFDSVAPGTVDLAPRAAAQAGSDQNTHPND